MTSSTMRRAIIQSIFGYDTISAITLCAAMGLAFGIQPDFYHAAAYLLIAGIAALAPDLDYLPYHALKKRLKLVNHWQVGHHPVFVIPLAWTIGWALATHVPWLGPPHFMAALIAACVTAHFIHDSVPSFGLHWFSPFIWNKHITLAGGVPRIISDRLFLQHEERRRVEIAQVGTIAASLEPVSTLQIIWWVTAAIFFIYWWQFH